MKVRSTVSVLVRLLLEEAGSPPATPRKGSGRSRSLRTSRSAGRTWKPPAGACPENATRAGCRFGRVGVRSTSFPNGVWGCPHGDPSRHVSALSRTLVVPARALPAPRDGAVVETRVPDQYLHDGRPDLTLFATRGDGQRGQLRRGLVELREDGPASSGVFGQRFDSDGSMVGSEFQVNTYTTGTQDTPSVAADASGNFVMVWREMARTATVKASSASGSTRRAARWEASFRSTATQREISGRPR